MNQTLSTWSIRNPIATIIFFAFILLLGLLAFPTLGVDEKPNIDIPAVSIIVLQHGASPSELESQVTKPIEDALSSLENVDDEFSTVGEGVSQTRLNFIIGTNVDRSLTEARNAIEKIKDKLPQNLDEIIVQRAQDTGGPFATYTVFSKSQSIEEISWLIDNTISKELLDLPGVGRVERAGGVDREIRVDLDPTRLMAVGLTPELVNSDLFSINANLPSGRSNLASREHSIRTLGGANSIEELAHTEIPLAGGHAIPLSALGTIVEGIVEQRQAALLNGHAVVSFSVSKSIGSNLVDVADAVEAKLQSLRSRLPEDLNIERIRTTANFVKESYSASIEAFLLGGILSVVVIWFFLKDWRATCISSLAIPLSVIPTFAVMKWLGFTLNNMSMLGLALVIGILVDDAIVEIENVARHMSLGKPAYEAAVDASNEIARAVIATSLALIVVFLPVGLMGGVSGQFFKQFGITTAVAVFFSLLVARMLTPMLAAYFMQSFKTETHENSLSQLNDYLLAWALDHRFQTIIGAISLSLVSVLLLNLMPKSLLDNADKNEIQLNVELSPGSTLSQTKEKAQQLTKILLNHPEISAVFACIGSSGDISINSVAESAINKIVVFASLKPKKERSISQQNLESQIYRELLSVPGIRSCFNHAVSWGNRPLMICLSSPDDDKLKQCSEELVKQLKTLPGVYDVASDLPIMKPGIVVRPDIGRAAEHGITAQAISNTAMAATVGENEARLARFTLKDRQVNIRVELNRIEGKDISSIENLQIAGADGKMIPLSSVADISFRSAPSAINRHNREKVVMVLADFDSSTTLGNVLESAYNLPAYKALPAEVKARPLGDVKLQADIFKGFSWAIMLACILKYAVLAILFSNFLHPLTILVSLPLSFCGALFGLVTCHQPMGLCALIGIIMLMGLVTKNSILLVDYALELMRQGIDAKTAIVEANRVRMRPITMTTVAMIAGMLPIALGWGAGAEVRAPMAVAIIGGLMTSNFFTLLLVPVVFTLIHDLQLWLFALQAKRSAHINLSPNSYYRRTKK